jgi:hypothetical protein
MTCIEVRNTLGPSFVNATGLIQELQAISGCEFRFQDANDDQFIWVDLGEASIFRNYGVPFGS